MTSQTFINEKNIIKNKDIYYGAYSRYLSDIIRVILGVLPFFLSAQTFLLDKKSNAYKTIHTKTISSHQIIIIRTCSIMTLACLPVLLFSFYFIIKLSIIHQVSLKEILIFYKILILWTTPTLLFTIALGIRLTIMFHSYLGVIVQIVIWFTNLNIGANAVEGHYGYLLIPRHNTLFNARYFYNNYNELLMNRISYCCLDIIIILISIWIFDLKRRGVTRNGEVTFHRNQN